MKWKAAIRFYLRDFKRPVIIFYGILMALFAFQLAISALLKESASSGGMEFASTIFLFVVGLNSFKSPFRLFLQNGLSRKTLFAGFVAGLCLLAAAMTLFDLAFGWFRNLFGTYTSTYMERFDRLYRDVGALRALLDESLWSFLSYVTAGMTGFFITSLYYHMNKALKLTVSIGLPMLMFIGIPLIDELLTKGVITAFCFNVIAFAFGFGISVNPSTGFAGLIAQLVNWEKGIPLYPYRAILFSALCIAFTGAVSFLLIRRATVKE